MSAISDYASLLVDAGEYAGRNDIAHMLPRFVGLAEAKFNRALRVSNMETVVTLTPVDGELTLPADYLEAREVRTQCGRQLHARSIQALSSRYGDCGGVPVGYAVVGNAMLIRPKSDQDITILYYAKIPPLTATNPTNWLLERAPDAYLYGLVEEIAIWERDVEKSMAAGGLRTRATAGLMLEDERARWGNSMVTIGGLTP